MTYRAGIKISVTPVAKITPKPSETASGTNGAVSKSRVTISGISPMNVVTEVKKIGLKRDIPESMTASCKFIL
jgi:hypothetical protein